MPPRETKDGNISTFFYKTNIPLISNSQKKYYKERKLYTHTHTHICEKRDPRDGGRGGEGDKVKKCLVHVPTPWDEGHHYVLQTGTNKK